MSMTLKTFLIFQVRYDDEAQRIVVEPLELSQEFRKFEYSTPWETFRGFRTKSEADEVALKQVEAGETAAEEGEKK